MRDSRWEISHFDRGPLGRCFPEDDCWAGPSGWVRVHQLQEVQEGKDSGVEDPRIPLSLRSFAKLDAKPDK